MTCEREHGYCVSCGVKIGHLPVATDYREQYRADILRVVREFGPIRAVDARKKLRLKSLPYVWAEMTRDGDLVRGPVHEKSGLPTWMAAVVDGDSA